MQQIGVCSGSRDAGRQRILEHIAAPSRVLSNHDSGFMLSSVIPAQVSSYLEGVLYRQLHIGFPAEAVRTEILSHNMLL